MEQLTKSFITKTKKQEFIEMWLEEKKKNEELLKQNDELLKQIEELKNEKQTMQNNYPDQDREQVNNCINDMIYKIEEQENKNEIEELLNENEKLKKQIEGLEQEIIEDQSEFKCSECNISLTEDDIMMCKCECCFDKFTDKILEETEENENLLDEEMLKNEKLLEQIEELKKQIEDKPEGVMNSNPEAVEEIKKILYTPGKLGYSAKIKLVKEILSKC
jgi:cell division septum initiation protein DivIVA